MEYFIGGSKVSITKYDRLKFVIYSKNFFKFFYFYDIYSKKLSIDMNKKKRMPYFLSKFGNNFILESLFLKIYKQAFSIRFGSVNSLTQSFLKLNFKTLGRKLKSMRIFYPTIKLIMFFILNIIFSNLKILSKVHKQL